MVRRQEGEKGEEPKDKTGGENIPEGRLSHIFFAIHGGLSISQERPVFQLPGKALRDSFVTSSLSPLSRTAPPIYFRLKCVFLPFPLKYKLPLAIILS